VTRRQHRVILEKTASGKTQVSVQVPFLLADAEIGPSSEEMERLALLHPRASPPRRKIEAARWFLAQLFRCIHNEGSALMFLEAFLTALRSATFALQKMFADHPDFPEWYKRKQESMREDQELRWIIELRNMAEKEGVILAEYGPSTIVRFHRDGLVEAEAGTPSLKVEGLDQEDLLPHLQSSLAKISVIIDEAHELFAPEKSRSHVIRVEYVRETGEGSWEHFDPS